MTLRPTPTNWPGQARTGHRLSRADGALDELADAGIGNCQGDELAVAPRRVGRPTGRWPSALGHVPRGSLTGIQRPGANGAEQHNEGTPECQVVP